MEITFFRYQEILDDHCKEVETLRLLETKQVRPALQVLLHFIEKNGEAYGFNEIQLENGVMRFSFQDLKFILCVQGTLKNIGTGEFYAYLCGFMSQNEKLALGYSIDIHGAIKNQESSFEMETFAPHLIADLLKIVNKVPFVLK